MKDQFRFFIAGICIGISELLPGISGATIALMFGVYEKILSFLTKLSDLGLMIPLFIGMLISVFSFSSLIDFLYQNFTNAFDIFISILMIVYGIYLVVTTYITKEIDRGRPFYMNILISIFLGLFLSGFYISGVYPPDGPLVPNSGTLVLFGFFACSFLLFPGISGSAFLLAVGIYPVIIGSISDLDFEVLLPFFLGMLISIVLMPRLINKAYQKYGNMILVFFGGLIFATGIDSIISTMLLN